MDYNIEEEFDNYITERLNDYINNENFKNSQRKKLNKTRSSIRPKSNVKPKLERKKREKLNVIAPIPRTWMIESSDPLERYTNEEFVEKYRFKKETVTSVVLPLIYEDLCTVTGRGRPVPPLYQLLAALRFYATGSIQIVKKELKYLSQPTVSRIVKRISQLFSLKLKQFINFPTDIQQTKEEFENIGPLPKVIGVIGGTHVTILKPGGQNCNIYKNNNNFSIYTQIVAGPYLQIFDIDVKPGSFVKNSLIESTLVERLEKADGVLVGGPEYTFQTHIITPLNKSNQLMNKSEEEYNKALLTVQNTVLESVKAWQQLFPCLSRRLHINLETTCDVINATAVLYNISNIMDDLSRSHTR